MGPGSLAYKHLLFDCGIHLGTDRVWNEMTEHQTNQQGMGGGENGLEPDKNLCGGWRVHDAGEANIEDEKETIGVPV